MVLVGESALSELMTRPDYAVTRKNALVGHIEVKAPGKGADPRKFADYMRVKYPDLAAIVPEYGVPIAVPPR